MKNKKSANNRKKSSRARSSEDRAARRAGILAAAAAIVDKEGFASLTMDAVAASVRLAKASLYGYYSTREELLLALLREDFSHWFQGFRSYLEATDAPFGDGFVEVWLAAVEAQPRLVTGLLYSHIQLEANVSVDFGIAWKEFLLRELVQAHYALLARFSPAIPLRLLGDFFLGATGITIGLWAQSRGNEVMNAVYKKRPELAFFRTEFGPHLRLSLGSLLGSPAYRALRELKLQA